jgi:hypothetical protein
LLYLAAGALLKVCHRVPLNRMNISRAINKVKRVALIAVVAGGIGYALSAVYSFSSLYYKWSAGLLGDDEPYHDPYPLGRCSVAGLHFGACFADGSDGSFAFYCDGVSEDPSKSGNLWNVRDGCALSLCSTIGGKSFIVLVPLPLFEAP